MKESFWKNMKKVFVWGGGGAITGALVAKIMGWTAVGLLGVGIGLGADAIVVFAVAGGVIFLAVLGIYKIFRK